MKRYPITIIEAKLINKVLLEGMPEGKIQRARLARLSNMLEIFIKKNKDAGTNY